MLTLEWYRDKGNGQVAADTINKAADHFPVITKVQLEQDGSWPVAVWVMRDETQAEFMWKWLLRVFQVNAITVAKS